MDDYLKELDEFYLEHYGRSRRDGAKIGSGRYPLGSGKGKDTSGVSELSKLHAESAQKAYNTGSAIVNGVRKVYAYTTSALRAIRERFMKRQEAKKLSVIRSGDPYAIREYMSKMSDIELATALKRIEQNTQVNKAIQNRSRNVAESVRPLNQQNQQNNQNNNQNNYNSNASNPVDKLINSGKKFIVNQIKETAKNETKFVLGSIAKGQDPLEAIKIRNVQAEAKRNNDFLSSLNNLRDTQKEAVERGLDTKVSKALKNYVTTGGVIYSKKVKTNNSSGNKQGNKSGNSGSNSKTGSSSANTNYIPKIVLNAKVSSIGSTKKSSNKEQTRTSFFGDTISPEELESKYASYRLKHSVFTDQNGDFLAHYGVKGMRWRRKKGRTLYTDLRERLRPYGSSVYRNTTTGNTESESISRPSAPSPPSNDRTVLTPWIVQAIRTTDEGKKFILRYADKNDTVVLDSEEFDKVRARGHKSIGSILYS